MSNSLRDSGGEFITILSAGRDKPQAKTWTRKSDSWGMRTTASIAEWRMYREPFATIDDLADIAEKIHRERTDCALIQGAPSKWNPCDGDVEVLRLVAPQAGAVYAATDQRVPSKRYNEFCDTEFNRGKRAGKIVQADGGWRHAGGNALTDDELAVLRIPELDRLTAAGTLRLVTWLPMFEDEATRVLLMDFDKIAVPDWWDWQAPPYKWTAQIEVLGEQLRAGLGPEFEDVRAWCCLSSSSGHPGKRHEIGMRMILVADEAIRWPQRRAWLNGRVDTSSLRVHQLVYIAAPIMPPGFVDPIPCRFVMLRGLHDVVKVPRHIRDHQESPPNTRRIVNPTNVAQGAGLGLLGSTALQEALDDIVDKVREEIGAGAANSEVRSKLWRPIFAYVADVGPSRVDAEALAEHVGAFVVAAGLRSETEVAGYGIARMVQDVLAKAPEKVLKPTTALPEYWPRPDTYRDVTLARQRDRIERFHETAARRFECLYEAAEQRGGAHEALDNEIEAINAAQAFALDNNPEAERRVRRLRAKKAAESRKINCEIAAKHGFAKFPFDGERVLVTGSQGTGKSHDAVKANARLKGRAITFYLAPTLAKAAEAKADYDRMNPARPSILIRGRGAPDDDEAKMCRRAAVVEKAAKAGIEVGKAICPKCEFNAVCGYQKQAREIGRLGEGFVAFGASPYVYTSQPLPRVDIAVIDEDVVAKAAKIIHFDPERLVDPTLWADDDPAVTAEYLYDAGLVRDAIKTTGRELETLKVTADRLKDMGRKIASNAPFVPDVDGAMSDAEINRRIDAVEQREAFKVRMCLSLLRREMAQARRSTTAVKFDPRRPVKVDGVTEYLPRIVLHSLRSPDHWLTGASILLLDGTGNPELARHVFGADLQAERFAVERDMHVTQTTGKSFSKSSLLGRDRNGAPLSAKGLAEAAALQGEIKSFVARLDQPFIASTMAVEDKIGAHAHFGDLRGKNAFETCKTAVVVGREQTSPGAVEDIARCFAVDRPEPFQAVERFVKCTRRRRMRDPEAVSIEEVEIHPVPLCQAILEQIREAEAVQAFDRVRGVFNRRSGWMLNRIVADVTVDAEVAWKAAKNGWRGGSRLSEAMERGRELGLIPRSGAELSRLWPDLWANGDAAKKELQRWQGNRDISLIDSLFGKCPGWTSAVIWTRKGTPRGYPCYLRIGLSFVNMRAALDAEITYLAVGRADRTAIDEFVWSVEAAWQEAAE